MKLAHRQHPTQIIDGDSKSAKFAMAFFILNIFLKMAAILYSTAAQISASEEYESTKSSSIENDNGGNVMKSERNISSLKDMDVVDTEQNGGRDDDLSEDSREYLGRDSNTFTPDRKVNMDVPYPPFTPGVQGLVSPYPRRMNHGVTPPRPPG